MKKEQIPISLFPEYSDSTRLQMMIDNCYQKEYRTFQKEFSPDEIDSFKSNLSEAMIQLNTLTEDLKDKRKEFALKMDPIKKNITGMLDYIKHKARTVTEEVFLFDYQETNMMAAYNNEGELVFTRKLLPAEKQTQLRMITGTDN